MAKQKTHLSFLDLIKDARDSRLFRKAEQSLYYHLALYVDAKKNYSCFPSYAALCEDTGLDAKTLQKAAASLQEKGLIHLHLRHNRSNIWFLNVAKVQETAELNREQRDDAPLTSPFAPPVLPVEESEIAPDTKLPAARSAEDQELVAKIHALLKEEFGEHPTYALSNSTAIMDASVEAMIAVAGSAKKCLAVLKIILQDEAKKISVLHSNQLGGYLQKCFPGWLADFSAGESVEEQDRPLCHTLDHVVGTVCGMWLEHPTFGDARGEEFLRSDLQECVDMAQSPERCGLLLNHVYMTNDAAFEAGGRSHDLGRYLRECFPMWLDEYGDHLMPVEEQDGPAAVGSPTPTATLATKRDFTDLEVASLTTNLSDLIPVTGHISAEEMKSVARDLLGSHPIEEILIGYSHLDWSRMNLSKAKSPVDLFRSKLNKAANEASKMVNTYTPKSIKVGGKMHQMLTEARQTLDRFANQIEVSTSPAECRAEQGRLRAGVAGLHFTPAYLWKDGDGYKIGWNVSGEAFEPEYFSPVEEDVPTPVEIDEDWV